MLVKSENSNSYAYNKESKNITYLHPFVVVMDQMDKKGEALFKREKFIRFST